ncbi:DUF7940 domain-containing protein [Sinorhizobium meliloti]|uniref:DUF7940 domain-containing protein n=1 Tax=Rhizobium meliloti TaxID=382 RepID=UPI0019126417|nr:hypothetical protein [Sinorhizobium meliloti]
MKLVADWRRVLSRAWSLRLIELAALADVVLNVVPFMSDILPWWITIALLLAAWTARLLLQPGANKESTNEAE